MPKLADNRRALYDFEILDEFEAGLVLAGHEVKAVRDGLMKLAGSYVTIASGEARLINAHIGRFPKAGKANDYDPERTRQLLLHKREISKLAGKLEQKGLTLVPISVYTKGSRIKLKFGLARGRKEFEKKEKKKSRDIERDMRRDLKG
ncbi:SsrA-binding protein SmpB [Patescibacteria group bacterium]|nr:SsrA-binding protein SmpB [Patescibacteria group bacterium]MBU1916202.1 SsrA-binding protein SmpB [Patescibacteria group bacterium]